MPGLGEGRSSREEGASETRQELEKVMEAKGRGSGKGGAHWEANDLPMPCRTTG